MGDYDFYGCDVVLICMDFIEVDIVLFEGKFYFGLM